VGAKPKIYLAGPMVFAPEPEMLFAKMKRICDRHELTGVAPIDNQTGLEGLPPGHALVEQIVRADISLMKGLDAGLFCLDGVWRGPEMDAGTAFEVGYMAALGRPLMGWTRDGRDYPEKVAASFAAPLRVAEANAQGGMSGALRDPDGMLLHSEGCVQNAMVHIGIELSGGAVYADKDWETAFTLAVAHLARRLGG
jgi:nucleoside 2-deoxyribosyltransferase